MNAIATLKHAEKLTNQHLATPDQADDLVFSTTSDIASLQSVWRNLEQRSAAHVFQTWAWVSNWHTYIGKARGITPHIIMATSRDGVMQALLPMGIETRSGLRTLLWLGDEHADFKGPLMDRDLMVGLTTDTAKKLFDDAFRLTRGIDAVKLLDMPEILNDQLNPLLVYPSQRGPAGSHSLTLNAKFDDLYKARRSASSRKKLRQRLRRLTEAAGPTKFKIARTPQARSEAISVMIEQKRARLAELGAADIFATSNVRAFYRALAEQHPEICHLSTFKAGDNIVATNWGLTWGDRYYYVLSTMTDGEYRCHSPGQLHLNELIEWSTIRGFEVFDFTVGDEEYKDDWCDTSTDLFDVYIGLTIKGRAAAWVHGKARAAKRYIKQSPHLWPLAKKLRKRLYDYRTHTA